MAMMVVLETLTPDERAVFVLREVFGFGYDEIAGAVGKSETAVRQMAHRAREHVQPGASDSSPSTPSSRRRSPLSSSPRPPTGDIERLISMLAPDVVWTADSDGKASAARRPVAGARKVAAHPRPSSDSAATPDVRFELVFCNDAPALVVYLGDLLEGVFLREIIDDMITNFYAMRNPDKLSAFAVPRTISR